MKNALNLFQFGRSNEDDEGDEDDNAAASFENDGGLSFYVDSDVNPFTEDPWENSPISGILRPKGGKGEFLKAFADFETFMRSENASVSNTNDATPTAADATAVSSITTSSEEYDNNANVEKSSSWSGDFTSFQIPKKDTPFTSNFVDDYEDDEGMWTKPLGASASTATVEQSDTQLVEPTIETKECITNGPCLSDKGEHVPEESTLNQL